MAPISTSKDPIASEGVDHDSDKAEQKRKWHQRLSKLFNRDGSLPQMRSPSSSIAAGQGLTPDSDSLGARQVESNSFRQVQAGLPRMGTFKRQLSERRERLQPSDIDKLERRTLSVDRRREPNIRNFSPEATFGPRLSASVLDTGTNHLDGIRAPSPIPPPIIPQQSNMDAMVLQRPTGPPTPPPDEPTHTGEDIPRTGVCIDNQDDLEDKWILNLSMHFRDKSAREKFFVTYAETATHWRRVTVSCDYRHAPLDSLEYDLRRMRYQSDKSARIYEAIRSSLPDIQFYDTVTNLRLETSADDRLHVHVTEDVNEIIPYPDRHLLQHLNSPFLMRVKESQVHFLGHMSGFVYKVRVDNEVLIKKEIPGPDSVEEFLYEINALYALRGSQNVVQLKGLVYDEEEMVITGLLIDYYDQGPLIDVLFDYRGQLSWERRAKWAMQIVQGLDEIHSAGFVQGDFTVSNICIGHNDNARIIDINRRGCPVGWEPPEIARMIESGQRISMYIGVKSDLFQLGMVLWAIAMEDDEPERRHRPLRLPSDPALQIPDWYREITRLCLQLDPRDRPSAAQLIELIRHETSSSPAFNQSIPGTVPPAPGKSSDKSVQERDDNSKQEFDAGSELRPWTGSLPWGQRSPSPDQVADERPRGRSPPRSAAHFSYEPGEGDKDRSSGSRNAVSSASLEPEIVTVDPSGPDWKEIEYHGQTYLTHVGSDSRHSRTDEVQTTGHVRDADMDSHGLLDPSLTGPNQQHQKVESENNVEENKSSEVPEAPEPSSAHAYVPIDEVDNGPAGVPPPGGALMDQAPKRSRLTSFEGMANVDGYGIKPSMVTHQDSGLPDMDIDVTFGFGTNDDLRIEEQSQNLASRDYGVDTLSSTHPNSQRPSESQKVETGIVSTGNIDDIGEDDIADEEAGGYAGGVSLGPLDNQSFQHNDKPESLDTKRQEHGEHDKIPHV